MPQRPYTSDECKHLSYYMNYERLTGAYSVDVYPALQGML